MTQRRHPTPALLPSPTEKRDPFGQTCAGGGMSEVLSGCAVRAAIQRFEAEPHFHLCHQCLHIWMHSADDGTGHNCPKCGKGPWKNGWKSYRSAHAEMRKRKDLRQLANLGAAETPPSIEQSLKNPNPTKAGKAE